MKKYLSIGKINFLNNIHYFREFLFKSIFILVVLFIFTNLWRAIYSGSGVIEGFTIAMMIWYLLFAEAIVTSSSPIVEDVNKEIQSGDVAYRLNKPYNYVFYHLARDFSRRILGFLVVFVLGSILVFVMVGGFDFHLISLPFLILSTILAFLLDFFMLMFIALISFWFEDTTSLKWVYDKILFTIGGMLIPLEIFPKWLGKISAATPFSFVAYHPAKLFVSFDFVSFLKVAGLQLAYVLAFFAICMLIYKKGVRRLNINGG